MAEQAVHLHGLAPSLDPRSGPITARVEVEGGTSEYLIDPERDRIRVDAIPGRDLEKWTSGRGLLLAARFGRWGLRAIEDHLPDPVCVPDRAPRPRPSRKRPHLPRDLASCPRCGAVVVLARDRAGPGFALVTPSTRLFRRVRALYRSTGFLFEPDGRGRGDRAGRDHARDCLGLDLFRPFPEPAPKPRRRRRARPQEDSPR